MNILVLTDGKAGHENQSKALAFGLGGAPILLPVSFTKHGKALSYLADRGRLSLRSLFKADVESILGQGPFGAIIGTGSGTFYPAKVLGRLLKLPVIVNLFPRGYRLNFDCVVAPRFDRPPMLPNVVETPVNLTFVQPSFYDAQTRLFLERHNPQKPAVGLIIGGPNASSTMTPEWMQEQLDRAFAATPDHEHWVTTSRRTPPAVEEVIRRYPFDYKLIFSEDQFNPIPAFITLCDTVFVTADSTGMLSESVVYGKASVEILNNLSDAGSKFSRFLESLQASRYAHIFDGTCAEESKKVDLQPIFQRIGALVAASPMNKHR